MHGKRPVYFCHLCHARCGSQKLYRAHVAGRKHNAKVAAAAAASSEASGPAVAAARAAADGDAPDLPPASAGRHDHRRAPDESDHGTSVSALSSAAADSSTTWWSGSLQQLGQFPARARTLDDNAMASHLDERRQGLLWGYLGDSFPHSPELVSVFQAIVRRHPTHLRVKELVETVESYKTIARHVHARDLARRDAGALRVTHIYDMACGHGLLGVLLAYRFPSMHVVCVDLERRPAFDSYMAVLKELGEPAPGDGGTRDRDATGCSMRNVTYVEADLADVPLPKPSSVGGGDGDGDASAAGASDGGGAAGTGASVELGAGASDGAFSLLGGVGCAAVVCVHACNEANTVALDRARKHGSVYAVMPCCIRDGLLPCKVRCGGTEATHDDARYLVSCGILAGAYGASLVTSIDRRITNRNVIVAGDFGVRASVDASASTTASGCSPR